MLDWAVEITASPPEGLVEQSEGEKENALFSLAFLCLITAGAPKEKEKYFFTRSSLPDPTIQNL